MRWSSPELVHLLWFVAALTLLAVWAGRARRRAESELGHPERLRTLSGEPAGGVWAWRIVITLAALALALAGIMRPQSGYRLVMTTSRGVDVAIALDLSRSMDARDLRPSRLAAAKREAVSLLSALEGSRVGLVVFAGSAQLVSPLSTDREGLQSIVETSTTRDLDRPGTDLGAALSLAGRLIATPEERPRAVVLLSDGENLEGDPTAALETIRRAGARVYTIGVGTPDGSTIPALDSTGTARGVKRDAQGHVVVTQLDERTLRTIAEKSGGRYERSDGTGRAGLRLVDPIRSGGAYETRGRTIRAYNDRFPWFAAAAGLLLIGERLIPRRRVA